MPIHREFIDWSQPALVGVVDRLIEDHTVLGQCELGEVVVVFPGRRAGRRFLELLAERSGRNVPPQLVTIGDLPELLYVSKKPNANDLAQRFAWVEALRRISRERLTLVVSQPPDDGDVDGWLRLSDLIAGQHRELAADGLHFGDVAELGMQLPGFFEQDRWQTLREIQLEYLAILDGLGLWDRQTARLVAIERGECQTFKHLILVGCADLNRTQRNMLDQVADHVTVFVHAPRSLARAFDSHGALISEKWEHVTIPVRDEQVIVADKPGDQATATVSVLASFQGKYRPDDILIGVGDQRLVPTLERVLAEFDVRTRWVVAREIARTGPFRLLEAVADYLESPRTDRYAALVRHPDIGLWLEQQGAEPGWLAGLDRYLSTHFQRTLGDWLDEDEENSRQQCHVHDTITALFKPLRESARPLHEWTVPLTSLLLDVYGHREFDRGAADDSVLLVACQQVRTLLAAHQEVPAALMPSVTAEQAIRLTLEEARAETVPPDPDELAVELLGWLELALDDSPALIMTGFNEGFVPSSVNADLFLPNALRRELGLDDNARRYARDAYALSAILQSREHVTLICGKRDPLDEPLVPSRLLFAVDRTEIPRRVKRFFEPTRETPPPPQRVLQAVRSSSGFTIPRPVPRDPPLDSVGVTAFGDFLESPYRFYLRHVLRLQALDDDVNELDAPAFGTLLHDVLGRFGRSEERIATDARRIRTFLDDALDQLGHERFGSDPLVPVRVQIEQARRRLLAFAEWQAEWTRSGWEIVHAEDPEEERQRRLRVEFSVDEERSLWIEGRIDRIDYHASRDTWAILDYKAFNKGASPESKHQRGDEWFDLQLPLYRLLASKLKFGGRQVQGNVQLGYIVLPENADAVEAVFAQWKAADLAGAEETARCVGRKILDQDFWQPLEREARRYTEFGPICQDGVFDREATV